GKGDDVSVVLIKKLERRLDNVVFRLGFAKSRVMARQLVSHGYFLINKKPVNIASYQVGKDDVVALKENKKSKGVFKELVNELKRREVPVWLSLDKDKLEAKTVGEPTLEEVKPPAEISFIFEHYSR
ncbi:MAG: 30S ribosomal protein S4, partial [Candidatus Staskawiczbacteria bacterium]